MNKSLLAAAVLSLAGFPLLATAGTTVSGVTFASPPVIDSGIAAAVVLYDQSANSSGVATVSQNFEASLDAYDAQAADDFTVPAGKTWTLSEVDFLGVYFGGPGPAKSESVTLYRDASGKPGAVVGTATLKCTDNAGSFACKVPKKVSLKAGKYWISIQANLDFAGGAGGEWGWGNQSTTEGTPAMWKNPGDGFATGCTGYTAEMTCIPTSTGDHQFIIKGTTN
jgi:hypothetical protein